MHWYRAYGSAPKQCISHFIMSGKKVFHTTCVLQRETCTPRLMGFTCGQSPVIDGAETNVPACWLCGGSEGDHCVGSPHPQPLISQSNPKQKSVSVLYFMSLHHAFPGTCWSQCVIHRCQGGHRNDLFCHIIWTRTATNDYFHCPLVSRIITQLFGL